MALPWLEVGAGRPDHDRTRCPLDAEKAIWMVLSVTAHLASAATAACSLFGPNNGRDPPAQALRVDAWRMRSDGMGSSLSLASGWGWLDVLRDHRSGTLVEPS